MNKLGICDECKNKSMRRKARAQSRLPVEEMTQNSNQRWATISAVAESGRAVNGKQAWWMELRRGKGYGCNPSTSQLQGETVPLWKGNLAATDTTQ